MDILFWSGGKDAYLALEFYRREQVGKTDSRLRLLTTFDESGGTVPHQNIPISRIRNQADHLGMDLITVPLPASCPNPVYLKRVGQELREQEETVNRLVFGDRHLRDIREWRENAFGAMGYECLFPIWERSIHELLPVLILQPVEVRISSVGEPFQKYIRAGETYDQSFVRTLPEEIDPMGERGEFHTEVIFREPGSLPGRDA